MVLFDEWQPTVLCGQLFAVSEGGLFPANGYPREAIIGLKAEGGRQCGKIGEPGYRLTHSGCFARTGDSILDGKNH